MDPGRGTEETQEQLEQQLKSLHRQIYELNRQNAALHRSLAGRRSCPGLQSSWVLATGMSYLKRLPLHAGLGIPLMDPLKFLEWANIEAVPTTLMVGRKMNSDTTHLDLLPLLEGGVMDDDGPLLGGKYQVFSDETCRLFELTANQFMKYRAIMIRRSVALANNHKVSIHANWKQGLYGPIIQRNVVYHDKAPTEFVLVTSMLVVVQAPKLPDVALSAELPEDHIERMSQLLHSDGEQRIAMLVYAEPDVDRRDVRVRSGAMRDHMALRYAPVMITTCCDKGSVLFQNPESAACMGVMGSYEHLTADEAVPLSAHIPGYRYKVPLNYMLELFGSQDRMDDACKRVIEDGTFNQRLRIRSHKLLRFMQLPPTAKVYHDVSISRLKDAVDSQMVYIVAQTDVTAQVETERRVARLQYQQRELLHEMLPPQVISVLLSERGEADQALSTNTQATQQHNIVDPTDPAHTTVISKEAPNHVHLLSPTSQSTRTSCAGVPPVKDPGSTEPQDTAQQSRSRRLRKLLSRQLSSAPRPFHKAAGPTSSDSETDQREARSRDEPDDPAIPVYISERAKQVHFPLVGAAASVAPKVRSKGLIKQLSVVDIEHLSTYHNDVTILFAHVQNFALSLHMSEVMLFLNEVFSSMDDILEDHDVFKVETVAETYMVCAGLYGCGRSRRASTVVTTDHELDVLRPANDDNEHQFGRAISMRRRHMMSTLGGYDPDHAEKMLSFAKAILCATKVFQTPNGEPVHICVGIHSGPITSGVIGTHIPRFCCFGDTVNTASRMATTGVAGAIHVSASFQAQTADEPWISTGGIEIKGKGMMQTYLMKYSHEWEQGKKEHKTEDSVT